MGDSPLEGRFLLEERTRYPKRYRPGKHPTLAVTATASGFERNRMDEPFIPDGGECDRGGEGRASSAGNSRSATAGARVSEAMGERGSNRCNQPGGVAGSFPRALSGMNRVGGHSVNLTKRAALREGVGELLMTVPRETVPHPAHAKVLGKRKNRRDRLRAGRAVLEALPEVGIRKGG